ncbi:hypothetical protein [Nonomuraea montanisoli]|nr:hypothetical protein [Nonomuraea montanisoli]
MSNTPAPEAQQERKPRKGIVVRRLDKAGPTAWAPSQGNSN